MNTNIKMTLGLTLLLLVGFTTIRAGSVGSSSGNPAHDQERLGPARQAGMRADRSQIPSLIAIVREKPTPTRFLMETTLLSLAQLGATDALPAINALITSDKDQTGKDGLDPNTVHAALAARARLIAENAVGSDNSSQAQAQTKVERFYNELGEMPADLNAALLAYSAGLAKTVGPGTPPRFPVELYALRELADMAYHSSFKGFTKLPGVTEVRFDLDGLSVLKVRLAPMSDAERAAWLVQDLSSNHVMLPTEEAEIQLAGDIGPLVSPLAATKLQEMDQDRSKYSHVAFDALFGVLTISDGPEKTLLKHFEQDSDPLIAEYARRGGRRQFIAGY